MDISEVVEMVEMTRGGMSAGSPEVKPPREYRLTRNAPYKEADEKRGRPNVKERQAHFIIAETDKDAIKKMGRKFPNEVKTGFTVELWKIGDERIRGF